MPAPLVLDWSLIARAGHGGAYPVLVDCADDRVRTLALARLGAERALAGDRILWMGCEHVARPLAWLSSLREKRLDARPLRPELGVADWPGVNPFDLEPDLLRAWLVRRPGWLRSEPDLLMAALDRVLAGGLGVRPWTAPVFSLGIAALAQEGLAVPAEWARGDLPAGVREQTALTFAATDIVVACGHRTDLAARAAESLLVLLAFATHARRDKNREHLVVADGWLDLLPDADAEIAISTLLDLAATTAARVVVAADGRGRGCDSPARDALRFGAVTLVDGDGHAPLSLPGRGTTPAIPVAVPSPVPGGP